MGETHPVNSLDSLFDGFEILAAARLVAVAPHENRGMVAVSAHVVLRALDHGVPELLLAGEAHVTVALDVSLGEHIDAVFVA